MDHSVEVTSLQELAELRRLAARLHAHLDMPGLEVQDALERGFARLMSLEAELQQLRKETTASPSAMLEERRLLLWIEALRDALSELRELTSDDQESWRIHGFVLPANH